MQIHIGNDKFNGHAPVVWDSTAVINPHWFIIGSTGSGKTYQIKRILDQLKFSGLTIHIFDLHGDIKTDPAYTSEIVFSNSSPIGLNPLKINPDPEYGGVRRRIKLFISMVNRYSHPLGVRQESVLRALLTDLYSANGIYPDSPASWGKNRYPTLLDLKRFTFSKLKSLIFGNADSTLKNLDALSKYIRSLDKKMREENIDNDNQILKLRKSTIDSFTEFVNNIKTGKEIEQYINYDSKEVLKSVYNRIDSLSQMSIFKDVPPDFDKSKPIRRYMIKSLPREEHGYIVEMCLEGIFLKHLQQGISPNLKTIVVLDESHRFITEDSDHITNIIIKEARKFGLGALFSTQDIDHLSRDILLNCGTKLVLSIDETIRENVARKLGIESKRLKFIQARKSGITQIKTVEGNGRYVDVIF